MEELKVQLDPDFLRKLNDAKITDTSLAMLSDKDLIDLNIELGPRKIIRSVINQMSLPSTSSAIQPNRVGQNLTLNSSHTQAQEESSEQSSDSENDTSMTTPVPPSQSSSDDVRETLAKHKSFRGILNNQLLANIIPKREDICNMVYILCEERFYDDMFMNKRYPAFQDKQRLAQDIIKAFPQLKGTRPYALAPPEAAFLWRNGGKGPGKPHTGWIETRVGNMRKEIPKDQRKFQRPEKTAPRAIDSSLIEKAKLCAALAANNGNIKQICDLMKETAAYHRFLIDTNTDAGNILEIFPHFCSFSGVMLQQAYERLFTVHHKADIRQTLMKCLCVSQSFPDVDDKIIRGTIRAVSFLTYRGVRKENEEPNQQTASECYASNLIKWVEPVEGWHTKLPPEMSPHIICVAPPLKQGDYYVRLHGQLIYCGLQAARAVDILAKSFAVLGIKPSTGLAKFVEFLEIFTYEVTRYSSRAKVNALVKLLKEMEDFDEEIDGVVECRD